MTTHDPEEAARLCDAIVILSPFKPATIADHISVPKSVKELADFNTNADLEPVKHLAINSLSGHLQ
jgi:ABC-type nitrate/sulfonate/bicarbonate transport system ATPase subunit